MEEKWSMWSLLPKLHSVRRLLFNNSEQPQPVTYNQWMQRGFSNGLALQELRRNPAVSVGQFFYNNVMLCDEFLDDCKELMPIMDEENK